MIRATFVSSLDQAFLSALNFGLAILLIRFATKDDYGLYSQLINLQSFFSPVHAGIFVSAYLALASSMDEKRHVEYRTGMARSEMAMTVASAMVVIGLCFGCAPLFGASLSLWISIAFGACLLGLWWREFVRQMRFASLEYSRALRVDVVYGLVTLAAVATAISVGRLTTAAVLWCMALGAVAATAMPLARAIRGVPTSSASIKQALYMSWNVGRWEVLGSIVTWGYAQSYIYFAAAHGGLRAAADVSAGRLFAAPLALAWVSYSNVLRPTASRLLASGSHSQARSLALKSAIFVIVSSALYALVVFTLIPIVEQSVFVGKFQRLRPLAMWWIAYFALTGLTTVAANLLRSALEFRQIFLRQVFTSAAAILLLLASMRFPPTESLIIALVIVEAFSVCLFWNRLKVTLSTQASI